MINSLQQLKIKFQQKNIIIASGNVYDTFAIPNNEGRLSWKNLDQIISEFAAESQYEMVEKYAPSVGRKLIIGIDVAKKETKKDEFDIDFKDETHLLPLVEYLSTIVQEIANKELPRKVYILDEADVFFDEKIQGDMVLRVAELLSAILDEKPRNARDITSLTKQSKVIFVARDNGNIFKTISSKNIELGIVNIAKPNISERKNIFKDNGNFFEVTNAKELTIEGNAQNEAIGLTDGFACKEIMQLGRIDRMGEKEVTFKELFSIAQFNKRESEWQKIDHKKIEKLEEYLSSKVMGQEFAITNVKRTLIDSLIGVSGIMHSDKLTKPKGIMFFAGPTGTGKTEMAKSIAEFVFGDANKMIRFDMSEYSQEHADQRLIGSPPGYVGYDSGGELTNAVKEKPFSILLFDEIEKAHGKILDKFLQILEDGRLTSSKGELVDFSETFIIFTSNIGHKSTVASESDEVTRMKFKKAVEDHFTNVLGRPEILNRIGMHNVVPFNYIRKGGKVIEKIITSKIEKANKAFALKHNIEINVEAKDIDDITMLIEDAYSETMGGRGVVTAIETTYISALSSFAFANYEEIKENVKNGKIMHVEAEVIGKRVEFKKK